ncbi:MAG: hypothetical protein RIR12_607 [Bacteroidota bacterium]|jgi:hypothetical protein
MLLTIEVEIYRPITICFGAKKRVKSRELLSIFPKKKPHHYYYIYKIAYF